MKTKSQKRTEAKKTAEAMKAKKKAIRDSKVKASIAPSNGKKENHLFLKLRKKGDKSYNTWFSQRGV